MGAAATNELLEAYSGRPPTAAEIQLVTQYGCVYRYLEVLWYLTQDSTILNDTQLQEKLVLLKQKLHEAGG